MKNSNPKVRVALLTVFYLTILLLLLWMESTGSYETPKFIYQGF